eukprot:325197_1
MGEVYATICPGSDEGAGDAVEEERKRIEMMQPHIDTVNAINKQKDSDQFAIENYQAHLGQSLYCIYERIFEIQNQGNSAAAARDKEEEKAELDKTNETDQEEDVFDVTIADPFDALFERWLDFSLEDPPEKRAALEEIWDMFVNNEDEEVTLRYLEKDKKKFTADWIKLERFQQQLFLMKFCVDVEPDLKQMKGIQDVNVAEVYNNINENTYKSMKDMMVFSGPDRSGCTIL